MRVYVDERGAERLLARHPWVFSGQVEKGPKTPGLYPVYHGNRFLALALYNPHTSLAVRAYAFKEADPWEAFLENLKRAIGQRRITELGATRLVHAEGDYLPGLVVDYYAGHLVMQTTAAALEERLSELVAALVKEVRPKGVLLKNNSRGREAEGLPRYVRLAYGEVPELIWFLEGEVWLLSRPYAGQKTGAFLDQSENRLYAGWLAQNHRPKRALDVFGYQGGFGLHIARHAREVLVVDSSAEALAMAERAAEKNGLKNLKTKRANAFDFLRAAPRDYADFVVLDPPSFARKKDDLKRAYAAYKEVNLRAMRLLTPEGVLVSASCSYHLDEATFIEMLRDAARDNRRAFRLLAKRGQAQDHPVVLNVPETAYLKLAALLGLG